MRLVEANIRTYHREYPRLAADTSQVEVEAIKELINVVSKRRSKENYQKYYRFWKFLYDVCIEGINNEIGDTKARIQKDSLKYILLFRIKGFNRHFFNKTKDSLQIVRIQNQVYYPYIKEVQIRVLAERANNFSGSTDLHQTAIEKVLKVPLLNQVNGSRVLN